MDFWLVRQDRGGIQSAVHQSLPRLGELDVGGPHAARKLYAAASWIEGLSSEAGELEGRMVPSMQPSSLALRRRSKEQIHVHDAGGRALEVGRPGCGGR